MNRITNIICCALAWSALSPAAEAVNPPPDGGYPNFTTAEGQNALLHLTTGAGNTAVGWFSLFSNAQGSFNTATGAGALLFNTGNQNTAIGTATLLFNTIGSDNTAVGATALLNNTATGNTAVGSRALVSNTTGGTVVNIAGLELGPNVAVGQEALGTNTVASANTAVGYQALQNFTTGPVGGFEQVGLCTAVGFQALANATGSGFANSAVGYKALISNTDGSGNTAIGVQTLSDNTTGSENTATGSAALRFNTTGTHNTATGDDALFENTIGSDNTATGFHALFNSTGNGNTAIGGNALSSSTTGEQNAANGLSALGSNSTGVRNTAVGAFALVGSTTGDLNTALGFNAGLNVTTASNVICIGANVTGFNVNDSCFIGNIYQKQVGNDSLTVLVDSSGKLGTTVSSRRFKHDIKLMDKASEAVMALKPVTFHYNSDPAGAGLQFGLIAEDVEKVNPDLIVRDKEGEPYSVRYDQVNAMLLNEFLKEHRKVEEQEATIAQLKKEMETVVAGLKEHDSRIQKVSAQIELCKAVGQTALNNP